jgi:hypothetical protein
MPDPFQLAGIGLTAYGAFKGNDEQMGYLNDALQQFIQLKIPDPEQQKLALEQYQLAGTLTPQLESAIKQDPSAFQSIVKNQQYSQVQGKALQQLQRLGEEGGLSLSDKADIQTQSIANANKDRANRDAITDQMARRGQAGSGLNLQAQLSGAQTAGDRDAQMRLQTLASARDRALKSIQGAGDLATNLQGQDYQQQDAAATAKDRINQFNTQNAQSIQQRNIAAQNAAAQTNLNAQQNMMNANIDLKNKEQEHNKALLQQQYDNQYKKAGAVSGVYGKEADAAKAQTDQERKAWGGLGSSVYSMGGSGGGGPSDADTKDNWSNWYKKTLSLGPAASSGV